MPFIHKLTPNTYIWGECWWNNFHMLWYCSGYLGYLVMAHYIRFHMKWEVRKRLYCLVTSEHDIDKCSAFPPFD